MLFIIIYLLHILSNILHVYFPETCNSILRFEYEWIKKDNGILHIFKKNYSNMCPHFMYIL